MAARFIALRVPASSANLGPGYDTLGLAHGLYLDVRATFTPDASLDALHVTEVTYEGSDAATISCDPRKNLVAATMLDTLPSSSPKPQAGRLAVHIDNPIPLGRGLGSSGSAVVAGVVLARWVGGFDWDRQALLERCVAIEGHPDNVAASLLGGFVASYTTRENDVYSVQLPFDSEHIALFAAVPDYHTPTALARAALPGSYSTHDVVHSLQRVTLLTHLLANPSAGTLLPHRTPEVFGHLLDDVIHQPFREHLIPGFRELRGALRDAHPAGILGACVSGAGPTVLIFANRGAVTHAELEATVKRVYGVLPHPERDVESGATIGVQLYALDPATEGTTWTESP
ncbi:Trihydroxynaphthalene reductase [Blastocladiella emersonii ATCC 22665]|nr:Trihydroxynaphthalene reductase [Blastocladiella emersonii ATCC 22665]KAI9155846.1 Trihydroxynaphthalene reductase [Blastocladiella emersonii ATCC 22665]